MRKPIINFVAGALLLLAALNEGHLNHWGLTIVLLIVASGCIGAGIWTLRE
ncbi:MAG TPA: hypothetical protein VGF46_04945 [Gaiellales bacterium]|jgi:hypothetical protein